MADAKIRGRYIDYIDRLREMIDVAGISSVFRGMGGSRQAGYAINQLDSRIRRSTNFSVRAREPDEGVPESRQATSSVRSCLNPRF